MNISREDFVNWKASPVTKEVMKHVERLIQGLEWELGKDAGINPLDDRYKTGAIQAFRDILSVEFEGGKVE